MIDLKPIINNMTVGKSALRSPYNKSGRWMRNGTMIVKIPKFMD